jgi:UDP-2-acetamido-3-amino-2,3-dideoxy-glucuronate N-acetyltransferase
MPQVHETAVVDQPAQIGAGTKVWHFSHVMAGARIGRDCTLGQGCYVGGEVVIGDRVKVQNNVSLFDGVVLEDDVFVGPSVVFTNVENPRAPIPRKSEFKTTTVRRGASVGANATLLPGVTLGQYSFIAAGAVVTRDVPDFALMAGVPARQIGWMSRFGLKLELDATGHALCPGTGESYRRVEGKLILEPSEDAP